MSEHRGSFIICPPYGRWLLLLILYLFARPGALAAQGFIDLRSVAPEVYARCEARETDLRPWIASGQVAMNALGEFELERDSQVPFPVRSRVRFLVNQENADRRILYRLASRHSGVSEKEIRARVATSVPPHR